jgi:FkbH-like protein
LALLLRPPTPLKGIITDLDDTLWHGLVGEVGPDGVSWDLDHGSQVHGLYQQVLRSLVETGVLVAVASKNDPADVQAALSRPDIVMSADQFFPVEVGWGLKSEAVERILRVWNIAADSVVFVDDSPMELAEVRAGFPAIRCVRFPSRDAAGVLELIGQIRDWFGKETVTAEDLLRLDSLRRAAPYRAALDSGDDGHSLDEFLAQAEAEITVDFCKESGDPRAIELINKTNQFNLNGVRIDETSWRHTLSKPDTFLAIVSYTDKFGALGKISVVCGCRSGRTLVVDNWVLSCRAFSRRIEHRTLDVLFEQFDVDSILCASPKPTVTAPCGSSWPGCWINWMEGKQK